MTDISDLPCGSCAQKGVNTSGWRPLIYGWLKEGKFNPCPLRYERTDITGRTIPLVQALWMMYVTNGIGKVVEG